MNGIVAFINSSVGKKLLMSLTGLFLCTFLIVHLSGNLLLLRGDNGEAFEAFSHFMGTNILIRTVEIGLFLGLLIHMINGVYLWLTNRGARPKKYEIYQLKENVAFSSRIIAVTAVLVGIFLVIHLKDYFLPTRFAENPGSLYERVIASYQSWWYVDFYLLSFVLLGYHLKHGFQSAFQTLGLRTKKYAPLLDVIAAIFWLVIPLGFAIIPLYFITK